jgi:hypothetical protein
MARQFFRQILTALLAFAAFGFGAAARADPPASVARLAYASGPVSFAPAGAPEQWVEAELNRPLTIGDRLWADAGARVELQVRGAAIRMAEHTLVTLLNVDQRATQVQLSQGRLNLKVRRLAPDQVFEVDTPNLAFAVRRPGDYRIEVDPSANATLVMGRSGQADVYGEGNAYRIDTRQAYRFSGTDLRAFEPLAPLYADAFDRWADTRERRVVSARTARYVPPGLLGSEELDQYGSWRTVADYGNVWVPSQVAPGWAPYRDGHWTWIEPWGWTWVDDAPWGFAVSHYGRWARVRNDWCWVPAPVAAAQPPVYAPALVAFVGGLVLGLALHDHADVGWFPLGPREVYRPPYDASRRYVTNVNTSNTVINTTQITNVYNNINRVTYVNRQVPGAVTAVPAAAMAQGQPVARAARPVPAQAIAAATVSPAIPVAPARASLTGARAAAAAPAPAALGRQALAKTAPPPPAPAFATKPLATGPERTPETVAGRAAIAPTAAASRPAPPVKVLRLASATPLKPVPHVRPPTVAALPSAGPGARIGPPASAQPTRPPLAAPPAALASRQPAGAPPVAVPPPLKPAAKPPPVTVQRQQQASKLPTPGKPAPPPPVAAIPLKPAAKPPLIPPQLTSKPAVVPPPRIAPPQPAAAPPQLASHQPRRPAGPPPNRPAAPGRAERPLAPPQPATPPAAAPRPPIETDRANPAAAVNPIPRAIKPERAAAPVVRPLAPPPARAAAAGAEARPQPPLRMAQTPAAAHPPPPRLAEARRPPVAPAPLRPVRPQPPASKPLAAPNQHQRRGERTEQTE